MFGLLAVRAFRVGDEVTLQREGQGELIDVVVLDFRESKAKRGVLREVYVEHEDGNCEWVPRWWLEGDLTPRQRELMGYKREITRVFEVCEEERICGDCGRRASVVSYRTRADYSRYSLRYTCAEHTPTNVSIHRQG